MYTVFDYARMTCDAVRMDAYARALAKVITPDSVVVDIGAGTGALSLVAARAGARRVHAIETNAAVHLLRDLAVENGFADRIVVHQSSSFDVELSERANVVVSDLRGVTPLYEHNAELVRDARQRFLAPGGVLIPARDDLFVVAFESEEMSQRLTRVETGLERQGFAAAAHKLSIRNMLFSDADFPVRASNAVTSSARWTTLDYATHDGGVHEGTVELRAQRGGVVHGLAIFFESELVPGIGLTTAPGNDLAYGRAVLPLMDPFPIAFGDTIRVTVRAASGGQRWAWDVEHGERRSRQSTFFGNPATAAALARESSTHRPELTKQGARALRALGAMDGKTSVGEIAASLDGALDEVRDLVSRYAR